MLFKPGKSKNRNFLRGFAACTHSVGLDVGQINTKIVIAKKDSTGTVQYQGAVVPTTLADPLADSIAIRPPAELEQLPGDTERRQSPSTNGDIQKQVPFQLSARTIKQLAARIEQVLAMDSLAHNARVGMTLSMEVCDYRTLYIPKSSRVTVAGVQQSIADASGDHRQRCLAIMSGQENHSDTRQSKVRCFSLPEDLACTLAQHFDAIGLMPQTLNGLPWCLANAMEMLLPPQDALELNVGLDWSYGQPVLVSVRHAAIDYVRCLSSGGLRQISAQAAEQFGIKPAAAGRWLAHCMNNPEKLDRDLIAAETRGWVRENCVRLATEIKTAMDFIRWRNHEAKLETIWLMGGVTEICGMTDLLQGLLPYKLRPWRLGEETRALTAEYALAASLAWMGLHHA